MVEVRHRNVGGKVAEEGVEVFRVEGSEASLLVFIFVYRKGEQRIAWDGRFVIAVYEVAPVSPRHYLHEVNL
ncbi:hypothetical protein SDC9_177679 [bioreactor metagenome]|uniref:Uncharacterized protein n=1 Tax=bioreactor metagenome TaxID=1076179 RepID=A0A645GVC9_9ZZZZ